MKLLRRKERQVREEHRRALVELNLLEDQRRKPSPTRRKTGWALPWSGPRP
jgi:hypothetical protein